MWEWVLFIVNRFGGTWEMEIRDDEALSFGSSDLALGDASRPGQASKKRHG